MKRMLNVLNRPNLWGLIHVSMQNKIDPDHSKSTLRRHVEVLSEEFLEKSELSTKEDCSYELEYHSSTHDEYYGTQSPDIYGTLFCETLLP